MIDQYINEILQNLENGCYYSALAFSLMLPDICGNIEYPNEKSVYKKYVNWYNKYIEKDETIFSPDSNGSWLSGEVIYNLRNCFLHSGQISVNTEKIQEKINKLDYFVLILSDATIIWNASINAIIGNESESSTPINILMVDVTYLCNKICYYALEYYKNNKDKFSFDFGVLTIDDFKKDEHIDKLQNIFKKKIGSHIEKIIENKNAVDNTI